MYKEADMFLGGHSMKKAKWIVTLMLGAALVVPTVGMAKATTPYLTTPIRVNDTVRHEGQLNYSYPQVSSMANVQAQNVINADIQNHVDSFMNGVKHVQLGGGNKYNKDVVAEKMQGSVSYKVMCNTYAMLSVVLDENASVPHKDGKMYTFNQKEGLTYTKEGGIVKAADLTKVAKICNDTDPFAQANVKACVEKAAKAKGITLLPGFANSLDQAKDNFYLDGETNIHGLFAPGSIAPEAAGWIDVQLD
jgi:hypothetical protein